MSEQTFVQKFVTLQQNVKVLKEKFNAFGRYNYRTAEDILAEAKPEANKLGLFLKIDDEIVMVGERYYVKSTATVADGTSHISSSAMAREDQEKKGMDAAQLTGATSSYARKYALSGLLGLDDEKDVDEPTPPQKTKIAQVEKKASVAAEDEDKRNEVKTTILKRLGTLGEGLQVAEKTKIMSELCGIRQWAEIEKYSLVELQGISSKLLNAIDEREKAGRRKSVKDISFKVD